MAHTPMLAGALQHGIGLCWRTTVNANCVNGASVHTPIDAQRLTGPALAAPLRFPSAFSSALRLDPPHVRHGSVYVVIVFIFYQTRFRRRPHPSARRLQKVLHTLQVHRTERPLPHLH